MHESVMVYARAQVTNLGVVNERVLEVGSLDVNGSVRDLFLGPYVGVDMQEGPGVDQVAFAQDLPFGDGLFGFVISTEMLEHDTAPWASVREMARVVKPGGHVLITCRGFNERGCFPYHAHPWDNWRYTPKGMEALMEFAGLRIVDLRDDPEAPGVFVTAQKPEE